MVPMCRLFSLLTSALLLALSSGLSAQEPALPAVPDVPFEALREQADNLQKALAQRKSPLPSETRRQLEEALRQGALAPEAAVARIQRLLDPFCLIVVTINPESRVKAAPGPAAATLTLGRKNHMLVKVQNEGGVTHALQISGPQIRTKPASSGGPWLEARIEPCSTGEKKLTGHKVEYVILELTAHEKGKREATLKFDVGQGTQDLGFRAEVPVLFAIR
jgi:hypothetical protein